MQPNSHFRPLQFYNQIKRNFPNVIFVSCNFDALTQIKNSSINATVTGSIIKDSVLAGIPVLSFGHSPYIGITGCYQSYSIASILSKVTDKALTHSDFINLLKLLKFDKSQASQELFRRGDIGVSLSQIEYPNVASV